MGAIGFDLCDGALIEFANAVNALSAATECPLNRRLPSSRSQISDGKPD